MKMFKKIGVLSICTAVAFAAVACTAQKTPSPTEAAKATNAPSAKIVLVGSTSVEPLAQEITKAYKAKNANAQIEIQAVGSSAGIKAAMDGTASIGMSSRELKGEEKASLTEYVIAKDGIAVIINPANDVGNLSPQQVTDIFMGKIKNWSEVGGSGGEIIVVSRESGSGTRTAFEELLKVEVEKDGKKMSGLVANAIQAEGNGAIKSNIASKKGAIGYVSLGYLDGSIKTVKINNVTPSEATILDGTYSISRPFLLLTKGAASGEAKKYIDFILSGEGQEIVGKNHYIKVK